MNMSSKETCAVLVSLPMRAPKDEPWAKQPCLKTDLILFTVMDELLFEATVVLHRAEAQRKDAFSGAVHAFEDGLLQLMIELEVAAVDLQAIKQFQE